MPSAKRNPEKAVAAMADQDPKTLEALNSLIAASEPMVTGGTRAVLGEGPLGADIAFVGEQPGDQEDLEGRPFVGPAGAMLDRAMREVGIDRSKVYVTNAVKHFKYEQRGKRRLHQSPTAGEVKHYRWWLTRELDFVAPKLVVALGATAVLALTGKALPVTKVRGPHELGGHKGFITVHPSYLLRIPDPTISARSGRFPARRSGRTDAGPLASARRGSVERRLSSTPAHVADRAWGHAMHPVGPAGQAMARISSSWLPNWTMSPTLLPSSATATGEPCDRVPLDGSASSSPTIVKVCSRPSSRSKVTV